MIKDIIIHASPPARSTGFRRPTTEAICGNMSSKISEKDSLATKEDLAEFRIALAELRSDMHQAVRESTKWSC